jgi:hypothetical protein
MPSWQTEITENNKEWFFSTKPIFETWPVKIDSLCLKLFFIY